MNDSLILRQTGKDPLYKTWHTSNRNMLLYVHRGDGNIVTREKSYPLCEGMLYFIGAEKHHYTFPEHIDGYVRSKLFFSTAEFSQLRRFFSTDESVIEHFSSATLAVATVPPSQRHAVEVLLQSLSERDVSASVYPAYFFSAVLQLMAILTQNLTATAPNLSGAMQKAVDYINRHITEEITVEDLCSAAYLSKYHFCRLFKQKTGLTAMEYVLKTRIVMAKEMLTGKQMSVGEVSDACGFSSLSYFCRVFKEDTGQTPLQYKKKE